MSTIVADDSTSSPVRSPVIGVTCMEATADEKRPARACQNLAYIRALQQAGAVPILIPNSPDPNHLLSLFERLDGLLLPGGGDIHPARYGEPVHEKCGEPSLARDETELTLARWAVARRLPLLAICRGIQVLNVALGGTLYQDIASQLPTALRHNSPSGTPRDGRAHEVTLAPESRLVALTGARSLPVNTFHHQAIKDLAPGLHITARAPDGIIEAVEMPEHPFVLAVQWHPEELAASDPHAQCLFDALVAATRRPLSRS